MNASETYARLVTTLREIALLGSVGSVLGWDERVTMPAGGTAHRAEQSSLVARLAHQQFTAPQIGQWLGELEGSELVNDPASDAAVNVR